MEYVKECKRLLSAEKLDGNVRLKWCRRDGILKMLLVCMWSTLVKQFDITTVIVGQRKWLPAFLNGQLQHFTSLKIPIQYSFGGEPS